MAPPIVDVGQTSMPTCHNKPFVDFPFSFKKYRLILEGLVRIVRIFKILVYEIYVYCIKLYILMDVHIWMCEHIFFSVQYHVNLVIFLACILYTFSCANIMTWKFRSMYNDLVYCTLMAVTNKIISNMWNPALSCYAVRKMQWLHWLKNFHEYLWEKHMLD